MRIPGVCVALALGWAVGPAYGQTGDSLLRLPRCGKCHALESGKSQDAVSFREVAQKYRHRPDAGVAIGAAFRAERDHAKLKLTDAELDAIAKEILALR